MATYYVDPAGSNTPPYDTPAKAANLPATVVAHGNSTPGPHIVYVLQGIYNSNFVLIDSDWANSNIVGVKDFVFLTPAEKGDVVVSPGGTTYPLRASVADITVSNITFTSNGTVGQILFSTTGGVGLVLNNVHAYDAPLQLFNFSASVIANNCSFLGSGANSAGAVSSTGVFNNCIMMSSATKFCGNYGALKNEGAGVVNISNCIFGGVKGGAEGTLAQTGSGVLNVTNSIVLSGFAGSNVVYRTNGTVNLTHSAFVGGWKSTHGLFSGTISTDTGNVKDSHPFFTLPQRSGYVIVSIDDIYTDPSARFAYVLDVEKELKKRNLKATWFIEAVSVSEYAADLREIIDRGTITIGCHSYSHSRLVDATNAPATYSITKTGSTISVDRAADEIVVSPGGSVAAFRSKSLSAIKAELSALGCAVGPLGSNLLKTLGESLADSGGAQPSPFTPTLLIDATGATGFYWVETAYAKQVMETQLGVTIGAFATPGGQTNNNIEASIKAAGFLAARHSSGDYTNGTDLRSINLYKCQFFTCESFVRGATDAETSRNAQWIGCEAAHGGRIFDLLAHNSAELTVAEWALMLDGLSSVSGLVVADWETVIADIIGGSDWSTLDNTTYARTWVLQPNYHLRKGSPCIRAGVDVGLTTDADGNTIPTGAGFDIGPYFYRPEVDSGYSPWSTCDGILPTSAQPCKSHALPIGVGKITIFDGIASAGQIEEAK